MPIVGIAISDIVADYRGHLERVAAMPVQALELQPELDTWSPHPLRKRFSFLSVHAPSQGRDIASPDERHRAFAVSEARKAMEFAHAVSADAYLTHPGQILTRENLAGIGLREHYPYLTEYYLRRPEARQHRIKALEASFRELASFYHKSGFTFDLCLENLPFPNLGATLAEYTRIYELLTATFPLKLTLDVSHAFVSHFSLLRQPQLKTYIEGYPSAQASFYAELADWLRRWRKAVRYYHLHGVSDGREHLPIDDRSLHVNGGLDLSQVLRILGRDRPLIVEVHGYPVASLLESARFVAGLVASKG